MTDLPDATMTTYVDGSWLVGTGQPFVSVSPGAGVEIASWAGTGLDQAGAAIDAARRSFDAGVWRHRSPDERAEVLLRLADLMEKHHEELAQLITAEVGSPISLARTLQTSTPVVNFRWAAERAVAGPRGGYREQLTPSGPPMPI